MHIRKGLFFQSLIMTLLLLVPMLGVVAFFAQQRQQQEQLRNVAAGESGVAVAEGAQNTLRLLLAVQGAQPSFVLLRVDAPEQKLTLCALPSSLLVAAPAGQTTLGDCYMAAGPARAAQLLRDTLGENAAPDAYFAATPDCYATLLGEVSARFDTAAVLPQAERSGDTVRELKVGEAGELIAELQQGRAPQQQAEMRAAVWAAFLRQNPETLQTLVAAARQNSSRTLTDLRAQQLYELEDAFTWLATQPSLAVEYTVPTGSAATGGWALDEAGKTMLTELLA